MYGKDPISERRCYFISKHNGALNCCDLAFAGGEVSVQTQDKETLTEWVFDINEIFHFQNVSSANQNEIL